MIRVRPFPLRLEIPRTPFRKMSMEGGIHMDLSIGNFPVTHTAIREYLYRPIIELIASENYASPAVMEAQGSA